MKTLKRLIARFWHRKRAAFNYPSPSGFCFRKMRMAGPNHPYYAFRRLGVVLVAALLVPFAAGDGSDGSLWSPDSPVNYQFRDYQARQVGDVITIVIVENSSAKDDAQTDVSKKSSISSTVGEILNSGGKILDSALPFDIFKYDSENTYAGDGSTTQSNQVSARLAVKIKKVEPNGNFVIEGRRTILIGKDKKDIILTGEISPYSVTRDNTVLSTEVADAQITYQGKGPINNAGTPSLLHRILDLIPFF